MKPRTKTPPPLGKMMWALCSEDGQICEDQHGMMIYPTRHEADAQRQSGMNEVAHPVFVIRGDRDAVVEAMARAAHTGRRNRDSTVFMTVGKPWAETSKGTRQAWLDYACDSLTALGWPPARRKKRERIL